MEEVGAKDTLTSDLDWLRDDIIADPKAHHLRAKREDILQRIIDMGF